MDHLRKKGYFDCGAFQSSSSLCKSSKDSNLILTTCLSFARETSELISSCELRGNGERAYVKSNEDEAGRNLDVIRILLTYEIDVRTESVRTKPSLDKAVNESIRKLLKDIVDLSVIGYVSIPEDNRHGLCSYLPLRFLSAKELWVGPSLVALPPVAILKNV